MSMPDLAAIVREAPAEALPEIIGALEAAKAVAWARLTMSSTRSTGNGNGRSEADQNLSIDEAARRIGMSKEWLYRHAAELPFATRVGRRLLFSAHGLEQWNKRQRTGR